MVVEVPVWLLIVLCAVVALAASALGAYVMLKVHSGELAKLHARIHQAASHTHSAVSSPTHTPAPASSSTAATATAGAAGAGAAGAAVVVAATGVAVARSSASRRHGDDTGAAATTAAAPVAAAAAAPAGPTHRYAERVIASLKDVLEMVDDPTGWEPFHADDGVEILRKTVEGSPLQQIKGMGVIEAPPRAVAEVVRSIERKGEYDDMLDQGYVLEKLDEQTLLNYSAFKRVWPTTARDFVTLQYEKEYPDGTIVLSFFSVDDPVCPPKSSHVRATVHIGGWILRPDPTNPLSCHAVYAAQVDLGGSLPTRVVNKATSKAPMCIAGVRPIVANMDLQAYVFTPPPPPPEADEAPVETVEAVQAEDVETVEATEAGRDDAEPERPAFVTAGPSAGSDSDSSDTEALKQIGELSAVDVRSVAMAMSAITLENRKAQEHVATAAGWKFVNDDNDVLTYRKVMPGTAIHAFLGKAVIPLPTKLVFQTLCSLASRHHYDRMLKDYSVVRNLNGETSRIVWLLHRTKKCLMEHSRDFVVVLHQQAMGDGVYVAAARSVVVPDVPETENVVRGEVMASGWYLEPLPSDDTSCTVTYLTQINVGSAPTRIINHVAVRQPQSVAYLRDFLVEKHIGA